MQHSLSNFLSFFRLLCIFSFCTPTTASCSWLFLFTSCFLFPPNSLRVLQWSAGGLQARSTELLHFVLSHPVDLICIQESNLNSSSSCRIPGFSALRADGTHSRSGIFSTDVTDASGGVIIFVRQGLSFSELSTNPLSSLDLYSDYVEVNISLNDSFSLSFLNVYTPLIRSSPKDNRTNFFSPSILSSYVEAVEFSRFHRKRTASTSLLGMPNSKMVSPFKSHPPIFFLFFRLFLEFLDICCGKFKC